MPTTEAQRARHLHWLLELTQIPTAAGKEGRVIDWIRRWAAERPALVTHEDGAGNLEVRIRDSAPSRPHAHAPPRPLYFTAHLDHPAFVVERIVAPGVLEVSFRGGVMADYFNGAPINIHSRDGAYPAAISSKLDPPGAHKPGPFTHYLAEFADPKHSEAIAVGDIATWRLPPAEITDGLLHTNVCDDLAAAAAALAAVDVLLSTDSRRPMPGAPASPAAPPGGAPTDSAGPALPRLLFTRAEEVGFIGAIAACRGTDPTLPRDARVIALENSRSFADSPIGGGPIVRVGDRLSVFSPSLTGAIGARAEDLAGGPLPTASQKTTEAPRWRWQRKLMPGGACEASVFCAAGYEATCLCLPLGNYHNMADLDAVQAGTNARPPCVAREFISIADFHGLVDLLVACAQRLPESSPVAPLVGKLWSERSFVLSQADPAPVGQPGMR